MKFFLQKAKITLHNTNKNIERCSGRVRRKQTEWHGITKARMLGTEAAVPKPISAQDTDQHCLIGHVYSIGQ